MNEGDVISIDGTTGEVMLGAVPLVDGVAGRVRHADGLGRRRAALKVRTNADTPHDAAVARAFGAEGIGLCRTEHMFFEPDRILAVREMILARGPRRAGARRWRRSCRCSAPTSRASSGRWTGLPVTIRLLDPPLHEFLPHKDREEIAEVAAALGVPHRRS